MFFLEIQYQSSRKRNRITRGAFTGILSLLGVLRVYASQSIAYILIPVDRQYLKFRTPAHVPTEPFLHHQLSTTNSSVCM